MPRQEGDDRWAEDDLFTHADWCDIINRVNDLIESGGGEPTEPEGGGEGGGGEEGGDEFACPTLELLECPEKPHIWSKKDIEEVQDKLEEVCDENEDTWTELEDIPDPGQLWLATVLNEIEEAIEDGWCNCCWDCPEAIRHCIGGGKIAPDPSYTTIGHFVPSEPQIGYTTDINDVSRVSTTKIMLHTTVTTWTNTYINGADIDGQNDARTALRQDMYATYTECREAEEKWDLHRTMQQVWQMAKDQVDEELERAEEVLEDLRDMKDEICAEAQEDPSRQGACDNMDDLISDQEEDIEELEDNKEQIYDEYDRHEEEADEAWATIERATSENDTQRSSWPGLPGFVQLNGSIPDKDLGENPGGDWTPDLVRWDNERWYSSPSYCKGSGPQTSEEWLEHIGTDDDYCWEPHAAQCLSYGWKRGYETDHYIQNYASHTVEGWHDSTSTRYAYNGRVLSSGPFVWGADDYHKYKHQAIYLGGVMTWEHEYDYHQNYFGGPGSGCSQGGWGVEEYTWGYYEWCGIVAHCPYDDDGNVYPPPGSCG